ncbi:MAG TPA: VCBS repeat-containing protein [bacterium]|nr:VCBS repeat-containing protein [bacterium]
MRRALPIVALATLALFATAAKKRKPEGAPRPAATPGVEIAANDGARVVRVTLPGPLFGYALPRESGGRVPYLLAGDGDAHRLFRLDLRHGTIDLVRGDLGSDAIGLGSRGGERESALLVGAPGRLAVLGTAGISTLVREPALGDPQLPPRLDGDAADRLCLVTLGALDCVPLAPKLDPVRLPLPVEVERQKTGLSASTPEARYLGEGDDGPLYAAGPEAHERRLRVWLLAPGASPERRVRECWALLPGDEEVDDAEVLLVGSTPTLVVTSRPAKKLGIFSKKFLRVFSLQADPTRAGVKPVLATQSDLHLWQSPVVRAFDADGDGIADLAIGWWKGLTSTEAEVDVYRGDGKGGFEAKPRDSVVKVPDASRGWLELADVNGDGVPDLLYSRGEHIVEARLGARTKKGNDLFADKAWRSSPPIANVGGRAFVSVGAGEQRRVIPLLPHRARLDDLDGDGHPEVILVGATNGQGVFAVVRFTP